jgi:hypothetical protein
MDCLLETVASIWMMSVRTVAKPPTEEETCVQENLEGCRSRLEERETELVEECRRLGKEAQRKKSLGDMQSAKGKMLERRRGLKRLEKLRSSLSLVDAQLDALRSTELDKELMQTLLASSAALKKAGVGKGVKEAEAVMSELDEQLRESGELTSVLAGGVQEEPDFDLDEEFDQFEQECELLNGVMNEKAKNERAASAAANSSPVVVNTTLNTPLNTSLNRQAEGQRHANVIAANLALQQVNPSEIAPAAMIPDF